MTQEPQAPRSRSRSEDLRPPRIRINVKQSTKGLLTFDCTFEAEDMSIEEILRHSDELVAELDKRYPGPAMTLEA